MKPEKILAKKFTRGKPYYKVKWHSLSHLHATWEAPPSLANYTQIIDQYEIKHWGLPLAA